MANRTQYFRRYHKQARHAPNRRWEITDYDPEARKLTEKYRNDTGQKIGDIVSKALLAYLSPKKQS